MKKITKRLEKSIETHGSPLDEELHNDMKSVRAANAQSVADYYPLDTLAWVLVNEELPQCNAAMIKICNIGRWYTTDWLYTRLAVGGTTD